MKPTGLVCLWEWIAKAKTPKPRWGLIECYTVDDDGHPLLKSSTDINKFLYNRKPIGSEDYDLIPIPGRVITYWGFAHGVSLHAFNPPTPCPWLSITGVEDLKHSEKWSSHIEDGSTLFFGTLNKAQELFKCST